MPHHGRGRTTGGSNSAAGRDIARDRGRRDQIIQEEENLDWAGRTIPPGACPDTPPHLEEFDRSYIREYYEDVVMRLYTHGSKNLSIYFISFVSYNWVVINHQKGEIESAIQP